MTEIHEIDLSTLYDELLSDHQRQRNGNQWSTKDKIYVSTLTSSQCDRQLRFIFDDEQKDDPLPVWPGLENEIGTLIHNKIQEAFARKNGLQEIEKKISITIENVKINMKVDGVFKNENLLEIKTLGSKEYDINQPRDKDIMQLNFYLGITGANSGIITYLKRDSGRHIKSFKIIFDRERYKKILYRICKIISNKNLRTHRNSCKFCQFTKVCKEKGYRTW